MDLQDDLRLRKLFLQCLVDPDHGHFDEPWIGLFTAMRSPKLR
jgi:hypothetical protein